MKVNSGFVWIPKRLWGNPELNPTSVRVFCALSEMCSREKSDTIQVSITDVARALRISKVTARVGLLTLDKFRFVQVINRGGPGDKATYKLLDWWEREL